MKILWGALRHGTLRRRYSGIVRRTDINGEPILPYEKIDDFRLWGLVLGDAFIGIMTRRRARPMPGSDESDEDTGALRGEA